MAEQRWPTPPQHADEYVYPQSAVRSHARAAFEAGAEFGLWLAAHDRETAARAWDEGYEAGVNDQVNWDGYHGYPPGYERHENPYREEADRD